MADSEVAFYSDQDYKDLKQAHDNLQQENKTLKGEVKGLQQENSTLRRDVHQANEKASTATKELEVLRKELEDKRKEIKAFQLSVPVLVGDGNTDQAQAWKKLMDVHIPKVELDDAKRRCEKYEKRTIHLENEIENYRRQIQAMERNLRDASNPANILNPIIDEMRVSEYDVIVKINSLSELTDRGWPVQFSKKYTELQDEHTIVVALTGLANKGKTYITNKLCDETFMSGFHYKTEGLSMMCGNRKGKVISFLDTAGYETPIPFYTQQGESARLIERDSMDKKDLEVALKGEEELIKYKINDRNATEDFLQNFIVETCNVILIVVSQLTYSDQKLVSRMTEKYKNKQIIIIHNFHDICYKKDIEHLIKTDIIQAFPVEEMTAQLEAEGKNKKIWITPVKDNKDIIPVRHLVMARDLTEAGDYYNDTCFEYIRSVLVSNANFQKYNLVRELSKYTEKNLQDYAERNANRTKISYGVHYEAASQSLILDQVDYKFSVKQVYFDARGELMKVARSNEYIPEYSVVDYADRLEVLLDFPGEIAGDPNIKIESSQRGDNDLQYLKFECSRSFGDQIKDGGEIIQGNRKEGEINIRIPLISAEIARLHDISEDVKWKDGVMILKVPKPQSKKKSGFTIQKN